MRGISLAALLLAGGCRQIPPPIGSSSVAFVEPPPTPPPTSRGAAAPEPTIRADYREARLRKPFGLPVYPAPALQAKAGRATVGVHITVDADGRVAAITSSMFAISTPGRFAADFRDAVEAALRQWRFDPARVEYFETVDEGGVTFHRVRRTETIEADLDLSFTFTANGRVEPRR